MKTIKNYIKKKLYNFVTYILDDDAHNIDRELQRIAKRETAEFILKENLIKTKAFSEFVKERNINFEYIGFVKYNEQVGIKITHV